MAPRIGIPNVVHSAEESDHKAKGKEVRHRRSQSIHSSANRLVRVDSSMERISRREVDEIDNLTKRPENRTDLGSFDPDDDHVIEGEPLPLNAGDMTDPDMSLKFLRSMDRQSVRKRSSDPRDEVLRSIKHAVADKTEIKLVRKITKSGRDPDTEEELWGEKPKNTKRFMRSSKWVIPHESAFAYSWSIFLVLILSYLAIVVPYIVAFIQGNPPNTIEIFDWIMDMTFVVDVFINFVLTYEDDDGRIIRDPTLIAKNYLFTWFTIDVLAAIPYERIGASEAAQASSGVKLLRLIKFVRFIRVSRIIRLLPRVQSLVELKIATWKILQFGVLILFTSHWLACGWWGIARYGNFPADSWVNNYLADSEGGPIIDRRLYSQYLGSLYWAFTTISTIGFGDITPGTDDERLFAIFAEVLGGGIFAFGLTHLCTLVYNHNVHDVRFTSLLDDFNEWMNRKLIRHSLRRDVLKFLDWKFRLSTHDTFGSDSYLLDHLSHPLKERIILDISKTHFGHVSLLNGYYGRDFALRLAMELRGSVSSPGEVQTNVDAPVTKIIFLAKGQAIVSPDNRDYDRVFTNLAIRKLNPSRMDQLRHILEKLNPKLSFVGHGAVICQMAVLLEMPCTVRVRAFTFCDFYFLDSDGLSVVFEKFPQARERAIDDATRCWEQGLSDVWHVRESFDSHGSSFFASFAEGRAGLGTFNNDMDVSGYHTKDEKHVTNTEGVLKPHLTARELKARLSHHNLGFPPSYRRTEDQGKDTHDDGEEEEEEDNENDHDLENGLSNHHDSEGTNGDHSAPGIMDNAARNTEGEERGGKDGNE